MIRSGVGQERRAGNVDASAGARPAQHGCTIVARRRSRNAPRLAAIADLFAGVPSTCTVASIMSATAARFYTLTAAGRRQLGKEASRWDGMASLMLRVLQGSGGQRACYDSSVLAAAVAPAPSRQRFL